MGVPTNLSRVGVTTPVVNSRGNPSMINALIGLVLGKKLAAVTTASVGPSCFPTYSVDETDVLMRTVSANWKFKIDRPTVCTFAVSL
jgi:hypothetical protein